MTSQEPATPHSVDTDNPDTEVIVVPSPAPVFVDSTGRRRRLLSRLSYVFGALCLIYGGLVSVSLAGGPVSSSAVLPLPDLRDDAEEAAGPRPQPIPAPSASSRPPEMFVTKVLPRRPAPAAGTRAEPRSTVRTSRPTPRKTPSSPAPTTTKPVASATVPSTTTPSTPAPSGTTPATVPPIKVPPAPPVPPVPPTGGGTGGGGQIIDETVAAPATAQPTEDSERKIMVSAEPVDAPEPSTAATGQAA